jgi:glycerol uptake facilitator-like aquaporin
MIMNVGGHINCAVSFALFLAGRISFIKALCYTLSQMLGAVMGALFLWVLFLFFNVQISFLIFIHIVGYFW